MNSRIIKSDLTEARDQINQILRKLGTQEDLSSGAYQIMLQHAFHHLNFAWNARNAKLEKYQKMSMRDFNRWRKFPQGEDWNAMHRTIPSPVRRAPRRK
jgi:hypothetical protein